MKFIANYSLEKIRGADYNPRVISEDSFKKLQESIKKFGVVKPVISNGDGTIVAGHQRTKAMKAVGLTETPIYILGNKVALQDEIKFNLIHNSIENETSKTSIVNAEDLNFGYTLLDSGRIAIHRKGGGSYIKEVCRLLQKYGEFGGVIIDEQGNVIHNSDYAYCCSVLNKEILVYKMSNDCVKEFLEYIGHDYGEYNYEALNIKPFVQTHCQMSRNGVNVCSTLYEKHILPKLDKSKRYVDFGSGKCFYINKLKDLGYKAHCYEPFFKTVGTEKLNVTKVVEFINDLQKDISTNGLYDVVILDSVINSITSNDYEDYVLTTCNALANDNAVFYTGTRNKKFIEMKENIVASASTNRDIEFLDKNNFCATFRKGVWTLQKFHTKETLHALLSKYFKEVKVYGNGESQLYAECRKPIRFDKERYKKALDIEFNLEYPNNYKHNKHERLVETILSCIETN